VFNIQNILGNKYVLSICSVYKGAINQIFVLFQCICSGKHDLFYLFSLKLTREFGNILKKVGLFKVSFTAKSVVLE
jgi:hypothetical protein